MFDRIETLRMASALNQHAGERQKLIAQNVANADTPGFRARDLTGFADSYKTSTAIGLTPTNPKHLTAGPWGSAATGGGARMVDAGGEAAPNGNSVSIEEEMVRITRAKREFDLSLAITRSSLGILRTSIGRRA